METNEKDVDTEILQTLKQINKKIALLNNPPIWRSLFQGLLAGLGTVLGATLLIAILITVLKPLANTPIVGQLFGDIVYVVDNKSR